MNPAVGPCSFRVSLDARAQDLVESSQGRDLTLPDRRLTIQLYRNRAQREEEWRESLEVVGINMADFRDTDVLLVRGKGKKERQIIIGEYAQRAIQAWLPVRKRLLRKLKLKTDALLFNVGHRQSVERLGSLDVRRVGRILKAIAKAKG